MRHHLLRSENTRPILVRLAIAGALLGLGACGVPFVPLI